MHVSDYVHFVEGSDLAKKNKPQERFEIALYGLAGEIGSLVAAVKKRLLAAGRQNWDLPNDEIMEELGDSIWYCFALADALGDPGQFLRLDIANLRAEIGAGDERASTIRKVLGDNRTDQFLAESPVFDDAWNAGTATLDEYQRLAFMTSRTSEDQLVEVCLAVLQQLLAELFRAKLPPIEKELNRQLPDRDPVKVLGETAWHLSALASLYKLRLSHVAAQNIAKLNRRFGRDKPTPLKDEDHPQSEQIPRRFEIIFVTIAKGRSRMYFEGRRLGDDLTDNAYADDGYRFHDVMHLALAAKLGWSPVLRKLMGRKRRSDQQIDEVEDGARAAIVEEAVIKAIHAEGVRLAALQSAEAGPPKHLFANGADISFSFLRRLTNFVAGLEAEKNHYWEWEDAIISGFDIFHRLCSEGQGTVTIDLEARTMTFSPHVLLELQGKVAALGTAIVPCSDQGTKLSVAELNKEELALSEEDVEGLLARKLAILRALGLDTAQAGTLRIRAMRDTNLSIVATDEARTAMWERGIVCFQVASSSASGSTIATALGIADD